MMGIIKTYGSIILLLFGVTLHAAGEELSTHIINNLLLAGKKNIYSIDNKEFAIISVDSLSFGNTPQGATSLIDLRKKNNTETIFKRGGGKWIHSTGKTTVVSKDGYDEFVEFLSQFSGNSEFQINHTIFPFPTNVMSGKEQTKRRLTMPRDWNLLNFSQAYPQMIHFKSDNKGNNRIIYIYRKGKMAEMFNFIRINKQWYLIEKFEFE